MSDHRPVSDTRLRVDPVACAGHGLCAHLLPEAITLDEWGYPVLANGRTSDPVPHSLLRLAQDAVDACPTLALHRDRHPIPQPGRTGSASSGAPVTRHGPARSRP